MLAVVLLAVALTSLSEMVILQVIILFSSAAVMVAAGYYYFVYRRLVLRREGLRQLLIDDVDNMSGVKFEEYVAELFRRQGYRTRDTPASGDYGVDLVVVKDGVRTAIQTKRSAKSLNQDPIREVVGGMRHYKCTQSMVVTNSYFNKHAITSAKDNECVLVDRDKLVVMIAHI